MQGKGLGEFLLMNALERSVVGSQRIASWAIVIDAKLGARDFISGTSSRRCAPSPTASSSR